MLFGMLIGVSPLALATAFAQSPPSTPIKGLAPTQGLPAAAPGASTPGSAEVAGAVSQLVEQQKLLIRLMADKGILTQAQAEQMIRDAEKNAETLRNASAAGGAPIPSKLPSGAVNIPYIPENIRAQIKEQVKKEVLATAKTEKWGEVTGLPSWINRFKFYGDLRLRGEKDFFDSSNSAFIPDFATIINNGQTTDFGAVNAGTAGIPTLNTTEDRTRYRLRARLGLTAQIDNDLLADFRITTGGSGNPVSTNQTLGNDFGRVAIAIDRAYLKYKPLENLTFTGGRVPNPFFVTDTFYDEDLNFDGIAGQYRYDVSDSVGVFGTVGGMSLQFSDLNFPTLSSSKGDDFNKWLIAAQLGADWKVDPSIKLTGSVGYFNYVNYEGKVSTPFTPDSPIAIGDTDRRAPQFFQPGNTLIALRDIRPVNLTDPQPELFGLASRFQEIYGIIQADWTLDDPLHVIFTADYAYNLGFDKGGIQRQLTVQNNFFNPGGGAFYDPATSVLTSGNNAYSMRVLVGYPEIEKRWDWSVLGGYKYLDPDALPSAFTDSDFHLGGTNAEGYFLHGRLGVAKNTWLAVRFYSATEVTDAPFGVDTLFLDLNAKF